MPSIIEEVVLGVFRPGTNNSTFQTLNYTLYALFVSIAFMFWSGTANVHSFVLLFLAVGLFFSVNWCARANILANPLYLSQVFACEIHNF